MRIVPTLLLLAVALAIAEIWTFARVAAAIGWPATVGLVLLAVPVGAATIGRKGLGIMRRGTADLLSGRVTAEHLAEGAVVVVGGVLLMVPGFLSDLAGLSTFVPPLRRICARRLVGWAKGRVKFAAPGMATFGGGASGPSAAGPETVFDAREGTYGSTKTAPPRDAIDVEFTRRE